MQAEWFNQLNSLTNHHVAYNEGNAGAFATRVEIDWESDRAFVVFTNAASNKTKTGILALLHYLKKNMASNAMAVTGTLLWAICASSLPTKTYVGRALFEGSA